MNFHTRKMTAPKTKPRQPKPKPPTKHSAAAAAQSFVLMLEAAEDDWFVDDPAACAVAPSETTLPSTMRTMTFQDIAGQCLKRWPSQRMPQALRQRQVQRKSMLLV